MQNITKQKIEELIEKTGHALCVTDYEDIEELDAVAQRLCGVTKNEARLLSQPFELSGVLFFPLTVAKSLWFSEKCDEWEVEGAQQEALLFWLLSLPNVDGELDKYSERNKAHRAIKRLSRRLHCSPEQMTETYKKCVGIKMNENSDDSGDYGGLIECLLREYGGKPDRWLYETPLPMIETLMNNYAARINAEADQARAKSAKSGVAVAPVPSERLKMLRDFRLKANEIYNKWSECDGQEDG